MDNDLGKQIRRLAREVRAIEQTLVREFGLQPVTTSSPLKPAWSDALSSLLETVTSLLAPVRPPQAAAPQRAHSE